jgi:uncharacterized membrane protein
LSTERAPGVVLVAAALTMGLLAGFFYAYSVSVMPGLGRTDDRTLVDAMQQINEAVENPVFSPTTSSAPWRRPLHSAASAPR